MKTPLTKESRANGNHTARQQFVPALVNIVETREGYVLEAEMPGVNKEGLEITLEDNEITIIGRRHTDEVNGECLLGECQPADYKRVFELDPAIDTSKIVARMDQGLLTLTLPKSERVKPRKIAVS